MQRLLTVLSLFLCLGCCASAVAQTKAVKSNHPTSLNISLKKTTYLPAEPVEMIVALRNNRERPIKGDFYVDSRVKVFYRKVGGEFTRYFPRWMQLTNRKDGISLSPQLEIAARGQQEGNRALIYDTSNKRYVLDAPGEYEIKATFDLGEGYESNIIRLTVVEPPAEERPALAALRDGTLASFIEGDLRSDLVEDEEIEAGAEKAADFLLNYPASHYAPLVKEMLLDILKDAESGGKLTTKMKLIRDTTP
jgi:hypothetical protein